MEKVICGHIDNIFNFNKKNERDESGYLPIFIPKEANRKN
jgi:hypothetical protein